MECNLQRFLSLMLAVIFVIGMLPSAVIAEEFEEIPEFEPFYEEPVYEEPVYEEPVYEEPIYEEPVYEEPVYEEPVYEEPVYEEPVCEEPVYEEPSVEVELPADPEIPEEIETEPEETPEAPAEDVEEAEEVEETVDADEAEDSDEIPEEPEEEEEDEDEESPFHEGDTMSVGASESDGEGSSYGSPEEQILAAFYGNSGDIFYSTDNMGSRLNSFERRIYDAAKEAAIAIAAGKRSDTVITIPVTDTEWAGQMFTAEELGVEYIIDENGEWSDAALTAMRAQLEFDAFKVFDAIRADCPYEMFWADSRYSYRGFYCGAVYSDGEWQIYFADDFEFRLIANANYRGSSETEVDVTKTARVSSAIANAHAIVDKYSGLDDMGKMRAYVTEIGELNTYNYTAAAGGIAYGDPWQLVYVFDGDPATNVVCEGYSRAFQYLCEASSFKQAIWAYPVTGLLGDAPGEGENHMWNIVHVPGVGNLLVDATNCDSGFNLCLVVPTGSVDTAYCADGLYFTYSADTLAFYTVEELSFEAEQPIVEPLAIVQQPVDVEAEANTAAEFTVEANEADVTYQWQYRTAAGNWTNCSSATTGYRSATLKPVATNARNGYQYRCVITNADGETVTSEAATLRIRVSFAITTQPADQTVETNATATFTVVATGNGLTYQWQYKSTGDWANCSSATSGYRSATLKPVGTTARNGYQYRCVIKDADGKTLTTEPATLTVGVGFAITTQPADQTVETNATATFTVVATGSGLTYQWQYKSTGDWANCSSATQGYRAATLKPVGTTARNGYQYRCVIKDSTGKTLTSEPATLTVGVGFAITTQPADQNVETNATATFTVVATGSGLTYQWQYKSTGDWANCSSATTGYRSATLKPVGTNARNGYQYRCVIKDSTGKTLTSEPATLTVGVGFAITTQPANQNVEPNATATFTVVATGSGLTYQWQYKSTGDWANCSSATQGYRSATLKPVGTNARNGYQYRCVVKDVTGKTIISEPATLIVGAGFQITTQPADQNVEPNATATFTVAATGAGLTYQWQYRTSATGSWANCSSATQGYRSATLKPVGTTARNGYQYRCVVKDVTGKTLTTEIAILNVGEPINLVAQPADQTVNKGETASFTVEVTGSGLTYQWQYRTSATGNWANCSSATSGYRSATVQIVGTLARNGYQYRCVVKDKSGNSVITEPATLTVDIGTVTVDGVIYEMKDTSSAKVIGYEGSEAVVNVLGEVNGRVVDEIGASAFAGNQTMTTISLPNTITVIRASAFANCTNLATMTTF